MKVKLALYAYDEMVGRHYLDPVIYHDAITVAAGDPGEIDIHYRNPLGELKCDTVRVDDIFTIKVIP